MVARRACATRAALRCFAAVCSTLVLLTGCASSRAQLGAPGGGAPDASSLELYGYVLRVDGKDTVLAAGAKVWTVPESDNVVADSVGYWRIRDRLGPGQYRVLAEMAGVSGRTQRIGLALGAPAQKVVIVLGQEETEWPVPIKLDPNKNPRTTIGPGGSRGVRTCCPP